MKKGRFFRTDVNEGGLNAWKDGLDLAEVEVPDNAVLVRSLVHELDESAVLDDDHPGLGAQGVDHDLASHV